MDHDLGFAPNPFYKVCTLACCRPTIRRVAQPGDFVFGMAGKTGLSQICGQLIFWMRVDRTLTFDEYWQDPAFSLKRPTTSGSKMARVGDNTYRRSEDGETWLYEQSMHYAPDMVVKNKPHWVTDTSVDRVLLSEHFTYYGSGGPSVSDALQERMRRIRQYRKNLEPEELDELHTLGATHTSGGVVGDPADFDNPRYFKI